MEVAVDIFLHAFYFFDASFVLLAVVLLEFVLELPHHVFGSQLVEIVLAVFYCFNILRLRNLASMVLHGSILLAALFLFEARPGF